MRLAGNLPRWEPNLSQEEGTLTHSWGARSMATLAADAAASVAHGGGGGQMNQAQAKTAEKSRRCCGQQLRQAVKHTHGHGRVNVVEALQEFWQMKL
ncbi:hypothetical protein ACOMHN_015481 [Nucella lapillus]